MTIPAWPGSTWERVCTECFENDEGRMLDHAVAYLKADPSNVPPELHLGVKFREILGARNRRQWWTTARDALLARADRRGAFDGFKAPVSEDGPQVIGRSEGSEEGDPRSSTRLVARASQDFTTGAVGTLKAELYMSTDDEDRGGYVLRLRMKNDGCAFAPTVRVLDDGIEVHMAGDAEGEALLQVLQMLTQHCRPTARQPGALGSTSFERIFP